LRLGYPGEPWNPGAAGAAEQVVEADTLIATPLVVRILYCPPTHIQNIMTRTYQPPILAIWTWAWWRLPHSEEEVVKAAIRWAVRAFVREIREVVGNVRLVDWVVM
jgi:hypothetical protein